MRYVANLGPSGFDMVPVSRERVYAVNVNPEFVISENFHPEKTFFTTLIPFLSVCKLIQHIFLNSMCIPT